jgi:transitional endoplasmic reticulum ATPase
VAKDVRVEDLAAASEEFTGADVQAVCKRAALAALREAVAKAGPEASHKPGKVLVTRAHLEKALEGIRAASAVSG